MNVAFQGSLGAYSHEALKGYFQETANPLGLELSEQVLEAVTKGEVAAGILPLENSIVGNVTLNTDLIYANNVTLIGEYYLPIQHCLLAPKGLKLKNITKVHSHPIALAQCRDFLNKNTLGAIPESDTAGAAQRISIERPLDEAAISSKLCADLYDLDILAENIQKTSKNFTRFVIFVRTDQKTLGLKREKTSLAFRTGHRPGALLECLQVFAKYGINLTKLESRPVPENPFQYIFYVDFFADIEEMNSQKCLAELQSAAETLKVLGCYPKAQTKF
jgi:prephenate dehydratase